MTTPIKFVAIEIASALIEAIHTAVDCIGDALGSEHIDQLDLQNAQTILENAISAYYDELRKASPLAQLESQAKGLRRLQWNASQIGDAKQYGRLERELEQIYRQIDAERAKLA